MEFIFIPVVAVFIPALLVRKLRRYLNQLEDMEAFFFGYATR